MDDVVARWRAEGFVVLPGFLTADELAPALGELDRLFPTAEGFHDGTDPRRDRFTTDEFDGIDTFPFASAEVSLLAVHDRLTGLAESLLGTTELRISSAEAWAKYTGATPYEQDLHRDYLNHTVLVPSADDRFQTVELFVYLVDVPEELGPPQLVSYEHTAGLPMKPNFLPREGGRGGHDPFDSNEDNSALYDVEQSGAGPAGSVIAFNTRTFHRGTGLSLPRGVRYSMQVVFRSADADWAQRTGWAAQAHEPGWYRFVDRATPRQLELFGFPPPGHPYWTEETLTGLGQRYPGLDLTPWR